MTFPDFFREIWGKDPFPWQERVADRVLAGEWPAIGLPTAAGKTALIDIAVFALARGAPNAARRIFFIVDRRVIVDEAAERASRLAQKLENPTGPAAREIAAALLRIAGREGAPLKTAVLRGALPRDSSWTESPSQPLVICSTVDQIGSGLLFRAYDSSQYGRPIRAALAAYDSLLILDEVHTSQPFAETLDRLRKYRDWTEVKIPAPFNIVEMSATPRAGVTVLREESADVENQILNRRWLASKRARLVTVDAAEGEEAGTGGLTALVEQLAREARIMRDRQGAKVVGVVVNRVRTAREVFEHLRSDGSEAILLTGRARPFDRDQIWKKWRGRIELGREENSENGPVFVIATQCIEVGANIDFDALVTELASIDALEQRFGRLNRDGRPGDSQAAIVAQKDQTAAKYIDFVYGGAIVATWKWLEAHQQTDERQIIVAAEGKKKARIRKEKVRYVEMGVLALRKALGETSDRDTLSMPRRSAPVLMPAHMDLLCQTSPEPAISPEPALFLHGPDSGPEDVRVVWRADLHEDRTDLWPATVTICPPTAAEAIALPVWAVRQWISQKAEPDFADVEGVAEISGDRDARSARLFLAWRGSEDSQVLSQARQIKPGATIVVPATYGGCDEWGWNPAFAKPVRDIGDPVKLLMGRPLLRLDSALAVEYEGVASKLRDVERGDIKAVLKEWFPEAKWLADAKAALLKSKLTRVNHPDEGCEQWAAISGRTEFQDEMSSFEGSEIMLAEHLRGCEEWADKFVDLVPEDIGKCITAAARFHDIGKADRRFQAWLRGGVPVTNGELLAKSAGISRNPAVVTRARERAGYPRGGRHEILSSALLQGCEADFQELDFELLLHLIESHHGRCRPFAPVVVDPRPIDVLYNGSQASSDHKLEAAGSGVSERFWNLTRRYGWYGLAFLETLVRLADHRQSEAERSKDENLSGAPHA